MTADYDGWVARMVAELHVPRTVVTRIVDAYVAFAMQQVCSTSATSTALSLPTGARSTSGRSGPHNQGRSAARNRPLPAPDRPTNTGGEA